MLWGGVMEDLLLHFYTFFIQFVKIHQTCSTVETGHKPKPKVNEYGGLKAKKLIKKKNNQSRNPESTQFLFPFLFSMEHSPISEFLVTPFLSLGNNDFIQNFKPYAHIDVPDSLSSQCNWRSPCWVGSIAELHAENRNTIRYKFQSWFTHITKLFHLVCRPLSCPKKFKRM